jgi:hypothetical protein
MSADQHKQTGFLPGAISLNMRICFIRQNGKSQELKGRSEKFLKIAIVHR